MATNMYASSVDPSKTKANLFDQAKKRAFLASCVAHVLHDGYTDLIYVLLPIWQTQFGIGYAWLAVIRALYLGSLAGLSGSLFGLGAALILAGAGSSTQHPIGSGTVSRVYGRLARGPLGIYNFAGDVGKAALPGVTSLLLIVFSWHAALWVIAGLGLAVASLIAILLPNISRTSPLVREDNRSYAGSKGFGLLFAIGILDTGVRMGTLIFLPFILKGKGASLPAIGVALALVFIGGAGGKFICGWLGARMGVLWSVALTEVGTAAAIFILLVLPLPGAWIMLPLLGALLNGTSSVLYGTVPEVASPGQTEHAFAIFYTGVIGSGALFPIVYGFLGDIVGINWATIATALTALLILPLAFALTSRLRHAE